MDGDQPAHAIPQGGVAAGQRRFSRQTAESQSSISRIFEEEGERRQTENKMEDWERRGGACFRIIYTMLILRFTFNAHRERGPVMQHGRTPPAWPPPRDVGAACPTEHARFSGALVVTTTGSRRGVPPGQPEWTAP